MEEDSREEYNARIRRSLTDWFGPFEEFHDRVAKNQATSRHGLIRAKMKPRPAPCVNLQLPPSDSPSHVPVHVALQSMRNLVDEPLSALPHEFADLKRAVTNGGRTNRAPTTSSAFSQPSTSSESTKKRKLEETTEEVEAKRKKNESRNSIPPSTPDSGVHSTESDLHEDHGSEEITAILNIMKTLDVPQLSPIPDNLIEKLKKEKDAEKERERQKEREKAFESHKQLEKETRFLSDSSVSAASTSREPSEEPEVVVPAVKKILTPPPPPPPTFVVPSAGTIRLKALKPEKYQKLVDLAKSRGKLKSEDVKAEKSEKPEKPVEKIEKIDKPVVEKLKPVEKSSEKSTDKRDRPSSKSEKPEKPERSERSEKKSERPPSGKSDRRSSERPSERPEKKPEKPSKRPETPLERPEKPKSEKPKEKESKPVLPPPPRPPSITPVLRESSKATPTSSEAATSRNSPLPLQKPPNKTVQNLQNPGSSTKSPSGPSPRSHRSTTPSLTSSRPSSSLSVHENVHVAVVSSEAAAPTSSALTTPTKVARWACQWDHMKLKTTQRVPIPDPTTSKQTKGELYHTLAKDFKSQADKSKDRVLRPLHYMLSSVYFVLEAIWKTEKDRTPQARIQCASIYRDTYELLGVAVFQGVRDTDDILAAHILPRVKVLGQIMLSVMQYQMYLFRADSAIKNMQRLEMREVTESIDTRSISRTSEASSIHSQNHLAVPPTASKGPTVPHGGTPKAMLSAGSTPSGPPSTQTPWVASVQSCPNTVTMPQIVFDAYKSQIKTANALILASRYWEDSKILARQVDAMFIKDIETVLGKSIGMDMPFEFLAQFVLTAVGSLKAEYEEEQRQPLKPVLAKMKPGLECAVRMGSFHPDRPAPPQQPHQTTPTLRQPPPPSKPK
ncbi:hypothetical protein L5515_003101 [Caenorhabditis briggsae]|uniref:AF4/FMR2 C-terminal homology domain-containing protein n=1 Tax=Caenorhabditis briggsae TaxID=6238 RepID=A0AAE9JAC8_CAEBR|nr:hypothetical protein L5515_003101 [Caenorhabditis briggsae]